MVVQVAFVPPTLDHSVVCMCTVNVNCLAPKKVMREKEADRQSPRWKPQYFLTNLGSDILAFWLRAILHTYKPAYSVGKDCGRFGNQEVLIVRKSLSS